MAVSLSSVAELAVESMGFVALAGESSDETFAVSGSFIVMANESMGVDEIEINGSIVSVIPGKLLDSGGPQDGELITNGSFENTDGTFTGDSFGLMSLSAGSSTIPGWTTAVAELAWVDNVNSFGATTPFGTHLLDLSGYHDGLPYGGLKQTIQTEPGRAYRLSLSLGSNADYPGAGGRKSVLACVGSEGAVLSMTPTNTTGNEWKTVSHGFIARAETTEVTIAAPFPGGVYVGLDNVSVVPDPSDVPTARQELVTNGSFEDACNLQVDGSGVMVLQPSSTVIPGWTTTTAEMAWVVNGNAYDVSSAHGSMLLDLTGYHDAPPYGGITQSLATTPGQRYQLSFALGSQEDRTTFRGPMEVEVNLGSRSQSFRLEPSGEGSQWGTFTWEFTADFSTTVLNFQGTLSSGGHYLGLDNISVVPIAEVPRAVIVSVGVNELIARFPVEPGLVYVIESLEHMAAGGWAIVPDTTRASEGPSFEVVLPFRASESHRFYRIRRIP